MTFDWELREREFNPFTTIVDDGALLSGESVTEILWCHHLNEMPLAAIKMEFRVNDGMASERINYSENLREEGGYRLPPSLDLCLH